MPVIINGSTGISGVDGSAGTPAFQGSDANTGIRFGTDIVSLVTGGSDRLYIDSSGRLGVGTTSSPVGASIRLTLDNSNGGGIELVAANNGGAALVPSAGGGLQFYTHTGAIGSESYSERVRIDSSGRLGIGTGSPGAATHIVQGSAGVDTFYAQNSASNNVIRLQSATSTDNYVDFYAGASSGNLIIRGAGTERVRIDSSGRLLIGTSSTSTSHLLQVAGPTLTSWFACDTKADNNIPASTTNVLTISGSSSVMIKVYIQVYFSANAALNAFFDYDILTADTGGAGGGATIRQTLNESVGSFQVSTGDFAVTRSANTVTITYTNQASGENGIIWRVAGLFNSLSIT
jgi:hypothetical protein